MRKNRGDAKKLTGLDGRFLGYKNHKTNEAGPKRYSDWHWGIPHTKVIEFDGPPGSGIQCGRLVELRYYVPERTREQRLRLDPNEIERCHLAFDHQHPYERLYLILSAPVKAKMAAQFFNPEAKSIPLATVAAKVGGVQKPLGKNDYPDVLVQPFAVLTHILYKTTKEGDGLSTYIHTMGEEEGGVRPFLCVDADGNVWLAGGSYTCPDPGITN